jgi:hypothetical protein
MTEDAARVAGITASLRQRRQGQVNTARRDGKPARTDLLRRVRKGLFHQPDAGGWSCPDCGLRTQDPVATRLGFCARCHEFTGMCAAGRKIACADVMSMTTWHTPCTNLGTSAWQVCQGGTSSVALLCPQHDAEVRAGRTSWLSEAIPLPEWPTTSTHPA